MDLKGTSHVAARYISVSCKQRLARPQQPAGSLAKQPSATNNGWVAAVNCACACEHLYAAATPVATKKQ